MLTILGVGRCTMGHDTFPACAVTLVLACRRLPSRLAAQESYRQTTVHGPTRRRCAMRARVARRAARVVDTLTEGGSWRPYVS